MASEQRQKERSLMVPAEDGGLYAVPESVLEKFRLSAEQRAEVEAGLPAGDDVEGFAQYIGQFYAGPYRWTHWSWTNQWFPDTSYYPPLH